MDIKSGWKTTEFWASAATAIAGILLLCGVVTPAGATGLMAGINQIVGGVMSIVPVAAYSLSRAKAKSTGEPTDMRDRLDAVATLLSALTEEDKEEK